MDPSPYQHGKYFDEDDHQARRISAAENLLRQDLSAIESIEATIKIIDVEMGKDPWYLTVGKTSLERVHKLLSKIDSIRVRKDRGSMVSKELDDLFHKFMEQVETIFKNLPKPLRRRSFLNNDLILLTDIPSTVQTASVFRDFQGIPAVDENPDNAILMFTYAKLLETCGWKVKHLLGQDENAFRYLLPGIIIQILQIC